MDVEDALNIGVRKECDILDKSENFKLCNWIPDVSIQ